MRIGLLTVGVRRWHRWLADDLSAIAKEVVIVRVAESPWGAGLEAALRFDKTLHKVRGELAFERADPASLTVRGLDACANTPFDLLIDCAGSCAERPPARRVLTPLFGGMPSELGAISALFDGRSDVLEIEDSSIERREVARPALENHACLSLALDNLLSSAVELLVDRVNNPIKNLNREEASPYPRLTDARLTWTAAVRLAGQLAEKLGRRLTLRSAPQLRWTIGVRAVSGPGLVAHDWPAEASYQLVPDNGQCFYADPFLIDWGGRTYMFCEEFPFATERGLISVAEVRDDGSVTPPIPVLERPYHLSHPYVFVHQGNVFMLPEAADSGAVELYRAVEFPYRWQLERRLLEGVGAVDPTPLIHDNIWWMFMTTSRRRSSRWDKLRLFRSSDLFGNWSECTGGLVTIDSRLARPAGGCLIRNGELLRPTQDCSRIYGGAVIISRIDQLSDELFAQEPLAEIVPLSPMGITGVHSYSKSRHFEAVDAWGTIEGMTTLSVICQPLKKR